jgi:hypothetical protein
VVNETNNVLDTSTGIYTITEGNYSALTLKAELEGKMSGYAITYDANNNKLTFSRASGFTFYETSTCFRIIGFNEGQDHISQANLLRSDFVVNLAGTALLYIDIPNITTRNILSRNGGGFTTIVKSIVCDAPYGSLLTYTNNTGASVRLGEKYISYLQVRILDDDYNLLDLNGQYFSLTIELTYEHNGTSYAETGNLLDAIRQQAEVKSSLGIQ